MQSSYLQTSTFFTLDCSSMAFAKKYRFTKNNASNNIYFEQILKDETKTTMNL